jgi:hypothetical protein
MRKCILGEFLDFYKPFSVLAYDEREILCEKVRAILTRKAQKLKGFLRFIHPSKAWA